MWIWRKDFFHLISCNLVNIPPLKLKFSVHHRNIHTLHEKKRPASCQLWESHNYYVSLAIFYDGYICLNFVLWRLSYYDLRCLMMFVTYVSCIVFFMHEHFSLSYFWLFYHYIFKACLLYCTWQAVWAWSEDPRWDWFMKNRGKTILPLLYNASRSKKYRCFLRTVVNYWWGLV